ncbi:MAG: beta-glucosidase, partial [Psychroserpens sp.]
MELTLPYSSKMNSTDFIYGVATASFQIEGGINQRLPCIWDTFCSLENSIVDGSNGDIACDHYHRWPQDIEMIESLGVDAYRLSISWGRIVNEDGSINEVGVAFYIALLDKL